MIPLFPVRAHMARVNASKVMECPDDPADDSVSPVNTFSASGASKVDARADVNDSPTVGGVSRGEAKADVGNPSSNGAFRIFPSVFLILLLVVQQL